MTQTNEPQPPAGEQVPERVWIALDSDYKRQLFATKTLKTGETEYVRATTHERLRDAAVTEARREILDEVRRRVEYELTYSDETPSSHPECDERVPFDDENQQWKMARERALGAIKSVALRAELEGSK